MENVIAAPGPETVLLGRANVLSVQVIVSPVRGIVASALAIAELGPANGVSSPVSGAKTRAIV